MRESLSLLCSLVLPAVVFVQQSPRRVLGIPKTLTQNCVDKDVEKLESQTAANGQAGEAPNLPF